jgi:hypothetical protein
MMPLRPDDDDEDDDDDISLRNKQPKQQAFLTYNN